MNVYGRLKDRPEIVLWEGGINPDGTASANYREMALPLAQAEELVWEMRKTYHPHNSYLCSPHLTDCRCGAEWCNPYWKEGFCPTRGGGDYCQERSITK